MTKNNQKNKQSEIEIAGIVGDFSWKEVRDAIIGMFLDCKTEQDFLNAIEKIFKACGSKKDLIQARKKLDIHDFSPEEIKQMEKWNE